MDRVIATLPARTVPIVGVCCRYARGFPEGCGACLDAPTDGLAGDTFARTVRHVLAASRRLLLLLGVLSTLLSAPTAVHAATPGNAPVYHVSTSAPNEFDLLILVTGMRVDGYDRVVVLKDFDAAIPGKTRAWSLIPSGPRSSSRERGSVNARQMTVISGQADSGFRAKGIYRVQGVARTEKVCATEGDGHGDPDLLCVTESWLEILGAQAQPPYNCTGPRGLQAIRGLFSRNSATSYVTVCAGPDGFYINGQDSKWAHGPGDLETVELTIKRRGGSTVTTPLPGRYRFSAGPVFIKTTFPGNATCTLRARVWLDIRDDGQSALATRVTSFKVPC